MENNKNQAEIYRQERKERLAKAAAKNAKKSPKSMKAKKVAKKVIAIVLVVALALGAVAGISSFFDIPEKMLKVSVDGAEYKISVGEFNYYYYTAWTSYYNGAAQYEQYGEGMGLAMTGFDYTKAPGQQEYTEETAQITGLTLDDIGNPDEPTWANAFAYSAISNAIYAKHGAELAEKAGMKLDEEALKEIDEQIESIRTSAAEKDYALDRWLRLSVGKGVTEKVIRAVSEEAALAQLYYDKLTEDTTNAITAEEIEDRYNKNPEMYDVLDLRMYTFTAETDEKDHEDMSEEEHDKAHEAANAKAKAEADAFIKVVKDEESFIKAVKAALLSEDSKSKDDGDKASLVEGASYSTLSSYTEKLAKWVFDDARKVGDKTVIDDGNGKCYAVLMTELPHKNTAVTSADIRHILIAFPDKNTDGTPTSTKDEDGKTVTNITDATKEATKAEAQKILDEFLKKPTEDNFAELTKKHTDDVDTNGNPNNDGLYKEVADNGQYVEAFTKWSVDEARIPGDTDIVETEYGYHIMYYVKSNGDTWYTTIQTEILNEQLTESVQKVIDELVTGVKFDSFVINWATKKENQHIAELIMTNS